MQRLYALHAAHERAALLQKKAFSHNQKELGNEVKTQERGGGASEKAFPAGRWEREEYSATQILFFSTQYILLIMSNLSQQLQNT